MQRNGDESCCTVPQRETTNVLMHLGWPLNTDSSVHSQTRSHSQVCVCVCDLRMRAKHIYTHLKNTKTITRHPRLIVSPSPRLHSPIIITLPSTTFLPSCLISEFGSIRGTYLAEEMTSLCLSESRILARWEATESAYWVMWTCEEERKVSS